MVPERFAISRERRQNSLRTLHENVACFRIDRGAASRVTLINRIA